jgi:tetratricopeptide (TPR) repeat protein
MKPFGETLMSARKLLAFGGFFLGVSAAMAQLTESVDPPELTPSTAEATIYFYRAGGAGRNTGVWAFVDATVVGVVRAREYVVANVLPGEHLVWATSGSAWATRVQLEAGRTYYFRLGTTRSAGERFGRETEDAEEALRDINRASYRQLTAEGRERAAEVLSAEYAAALDAAELENLARSVREGVYPAGSPQEIQAIFDYGEKLVQSGRSSDARREYYEAISLIEEHHGESSVMLAEAYRLLAASYYQDFHELGTNRPIIEWLRTAINFLEQQPNPDPQLLATVLLDMGDANTAFARRGSGRNGAEYYLRAWDLLESLENADEIRRAWFSSARPVWVWEPFGSAGLLSSESVEQGSVVVMFDVDKLGQTLNVRIASSDPPGLKDSEAISSMRSTLFRPKMENRQFVPSLGMSKEYVFTYTPDE